MANRIQVSPEAPRGKPTRTFPLGWAREGIVGLRLQSTVSRSLRLFDASINIYTDESDLEPLNAYRRGKIATYLQLQRELFGEDHKEVLPSFDSHVNPSHAALQVRAARTSPASSLPPLSPPMHSSPQPTAVSDAYCFKQIFLTL